MAYVVLFIIIGIGVIAIVNIVRNRQQKKQKEQLAQLHEKKVLATVTAIEEKKDTRVVREGDPETITRFYLKAKWTDPQDQQTYFFTSPPLLDKPGTAVGGSVEVKMDIQNPYSYKMVIVF